LSNKPEEIAERQKMKPPEMDLEPIPGQAKATPSDSDDGKTEGMPDSDLADDGTATPPYMKRDN
jgi:hypothetical protein